MTDYIQVSREGLEIWEDDLFHIPPLTKVKVWVELMLGSEEGAKRKMEEARNGLR